MSIRSLVGSIATCTRSASPWGWDQWETILDTYRDVNALFGDVIKVTPSSKCVGDLALYLVNCKVSAPSPSLYISPSEVNLTPISLSLCLCASF